MSANVCFKNKIFFLLKNVLFDGCAICMIFISFNIIIYNEKILINQVKRERQRPFRSTYTTHYKFSELTFNKEKRKLHCTVHKNVVEFPNFQTLNISNRIVIL